MYRVTEHEYIESKDDFNPKNVGVPCLTLGQAKALAKSSHEETGEYYLITKDGNKAVKIWHDEC